MQDFKKLNNILLAILIILVFVLFARDIIHQKTIETQKDTIAICDEHIDSLEETIRLQEQQIDILEQKLDEQNSTDDNTDGDEPITTGLPELYSASM